MGKLVAEMIVRCPVLHLLIGGSIGFGRLVSDSAIRNGFGKIYDNVNFQAGIPVLVEIGNSESAVDGLTSGSGVFRLE